MPVVQSLLAPHVVSHTDHVILGTHCNTHESDTELHDLLIHSVFSM